MTNLNDHPAGETQNRALVPVSSPVAVDTFGGRVHVEIVRITSLGDGVSDTRREL